MESDVPGHRSRVVLKTVSRMPRTLISPLYAIDIAVLGWVSLGSLSYGICAYFLGNWSGSRSCAASIGEQIAWFSWTFQVQTAAFGAVLLLNLLNLGMRQHLLPFKCNLLLLYINGVAFVTDLLLWRGVTTIQLSSSSRPFAPLRYVQWGHSTPTMIYMMALLSDCTGWQLLFALMSDVAMVATGLVACYTDGLLKVFVTLISFGTFAVVLSYMYGMFQKTLSGNVSPEQRSALRTVLVLLLALWSAFPMVWLAADWQLIDPQVEAMCWGVCDYLAKVVFSSQLWQSNLTEVQLRRDRALEAWEASNRVEAVARLTALVKQRDNLLSTLSHELRTPLAGIVALSESLCQEVSIALPASAQTLATVRATATCMLSIVTSTLESFTARSDGELVSWSQLPGEDVSPHGLGAASVPLNPLELRPLVETVINVLRPLAQDGVAIVSDLPPNLPPVAVDATRLSQVLYNLVGNAIRFTSHGEVKVAARVVLPEGANAAPAGLCGDGAESISTTHSGGGVNAGGLWHCARPRLSFSSHSSHRSSVMSFPSGTQVEVSVEDTGVGIAQELLDELFLPNRTGNVVQSIADATGSSAEVGGVLSGKVSRCIGGTGLGLYLVRLALKAQGSTVVAESAPGVGSVFRFRLAVAQQQHHQGTTQDQTSSGANATTRVPHPQQHPKPQQQNLDLLEELQSRLVNQQQQQRQQQQQQRPHAGNETCVAVWECGDHRSVCALHEAGRSPSSASGGDCATARPEPSSPRQSAAVLTTSKPLVSAPIVRLAKLSTTAAATSDGGSDGGGGGSNRIANTYTTPAARVAQEHQPPLTSDHVVHHLSLSPIRTQTVRTGLDTEHRSLLVPPPTALPPTASSVSSSAPSTTTRCRASCAAGCCASKVDSISQDSAALLIPIMGSEGELRSSQAGEGTAAVTGGNSGGSEGLSAAGLPPVISSPPPLPVVPVVTPELTPIPTPTDLMSRTLVPGVMSTTAFDKALTIEEARTSMLAKAGLRLNFRHRNNGKLQIMSVDDDAINQLVAGQMLSSQSWMVVKCMNGPEALAHLQLMPRPGTAAVVDAAVSASTMSGTGSPAPPGTAPAVAAASLAAAAVAAQPRLLLTVLPDCVLLDVMMPGMNGFEVCRKLRQHFSSAQLPVIIVSAKGDAAAVEEAFESGADDYMTKPYKRAEMVARIKAQVRIRDSALNAAVAMGTAMTAEVTALPPPATTTATTGLQPLSTLAPVSHPAGGTAVSHPAGGTAVSSALRSFMSCGAGAVERTSPSPSPLHPLSQVQVQQEGRPASADVLLMPQCTPHSIKARMEASRGGLDGSWGRVGLYKRDGVVNRTGMVDSTTSSWDAISATGPPKDNARALVAILGSPQQEIQPARAGAVATSDFGIAGGGIAGGGIQCPLDGSSRSWSKRWTEPLLKTADAVVRASTPLSLLPQNTMVSPPGDLSCVTTASASAGTATGLTLDPPTTATPACLPPSDTTAVTATGVGLALEAADVEPPLVTSVNFNGGVLGVSLDCKASGEDLREPGDVTALMRKVLTEVCRSRVEEAEHQKLTSRLAALRTACCTMAAERDGWQRQARDLQALLAMWLSGAGAVGAAASLPPAHAGHGNAMPPHMTLADALAAAQGSHFSADNFGAAAIRGCVACGQHVRVAAQLEDLKKDAVLLRQQLTVALASTGDNLRIMSGSMDMAGSRTCEVPTVRPQHTVLKPRASGFPQAAGLTGVDTTVGDIIQSGGAAVAGRQSWGAATLPNPAFTTTTDLFMMTQDSCLSGECGAGGGQSNDSDSGEGRRGGATTLSSPPLVSQVHQHTQSSDLNRAAANTSARQSTMALSGAPSSPLRTSATVGVWQGAAPFDCTVGKQTNGADAANGRCVDPEAELSVASLVEPTGSPVAVMAATATTMPPSPPQTLGALTSSSSASNGSRWATSNTSVGDEVSQTSSASRAPAVPNASSSRGGGRGDSSRLRGGGNNSSGATVTGGILRMLCSKGVVVSSTPSVMLE